MTENEENKDVLINLAIVKEQLQNSNENHKKMYDVQQVLFDKLDASEKVSSDTKSRVETLTQTTDLKFLELSKEVTTNKTEVTTNKKEFDDFKTDEFKPVSNAIETAKGGLYVVKVVYPVIFIIIQLIGLAVAIYFGGK